MSAGAFTNPCAHAEQVATYALQALPARDVPAVEAHILGCPHCRAELAALRPAVDSLVAWPADVLRPTRSLCARLAARIAEETGTPAVPPPTSPGSGWREPDWEEVSPGIFCKLLANDAERRRISMLVRLLPNVEYPPHTHAEFEELHLLDGELWIDERKLHAGDYYRAKVGSADARVWSETGCTCVLITSTDDMLS